MGSYQDLFQIRGFSRFLGTQFLGVLNDNIYKMVVSLAAVSLVAGDSSNAYLSIAQAIFIVPFLLFSGYAGHLADVRSKRNVMVWVKAFEIIVMSAAIGALWLQSMPLLLGVLFLMALQSTFFSPAKYGFLPEVLSESEISRGNGIVQMLTFVAIIAGTALAGVLFSAADGRLWPFAVVLIGLAVAGTVMSWGIAKRPAADPGKPFQINPFAETIAGIRGLYADRPLWLATLGTCWFWLLGAMMQITFLIYGKEIIGINEGWQLSLLIAAVGLGIGLGSMLAGRWSGQKIELGLVPIGAAIMAIALILLSVPVWNYYSAAALILLSGAGGGLFIVPLEAFLQKRSPSDQRGRFLAARNFLTTGAVLIASGGNLLLTNVFGLGADAVIGFAAILTLIGFAFGLVILPEFVVRFGFWLATHTLYRIKIRGKGNVPQQGPALLVANHVGFADAFLVSSCVQRFVRFLCHRYYYEHRLFHWILSRMKVIPVEGGNPQVVSEAIERSKEQLRRGHVVCIFAEGHLTPDGKMLPFRTGFQRIAEGLDVPVIPVHIGGVWGSLFSRSDGHPIWKLTKEPLRPITITFGEPLEGDETAEEVQTIVEQLENYDPIAARAAAHQQELQRWTTIMRQAAQA